MGVATDGVARAWWRLRLAVTPLFLPAGHHETPWAFIRPLKLRLPFVVQVAYGCQAKDLYGQAGVHTYLTFFGANVRIHERPLWHS